MNERTETGTGSSGSEQEPRQRRHRDLLPKDLCPALMMKQILVHGLDDVVFDDRTYPGDGYYWCECTCTAVGPDDELVDVDTCRPQRACWNGVAS